MRKIIPFICLLALPFIVSAQSNRTVTGKNDSLHLGPALTDSTPVLQLRDIQELANMIQDYPAKYANPITNWLSERFQLRAKEYMLKPKK